MTQFINSSLYDDLKWRGLIFQDTDSQTLASLLKKPPQAVYCGFDPTADSLHIGSLVPLLCLRRFQMAGHKPFALVGGATGMIGDPSGKSSERALNSDETVRGWTERVRTQLEKFLDFSNGPSQAKVVNNYDWISPLSTIEFLRDVGKHFTLNWMLAKDSVQSRLGREDGGISYTEFSYMLLQAYDFYYLAKSHGCQIQVGGSDQWGNLTAGIELIGKKLKTQAYGLTFPLVTTATGTKFGKTETGTIWLDADKTPPYTFYQFWLNVDDRDVIRFLKYFTFLSPEQINTLEEEVSTKPELRSAQKELASQMTKLVHGDDELKKAQQASAALFGAGDLHELDLKTLQSATASAPTFEIKSVSEIQKLSGLLVDTKLCTSRSQATQMITAGGVYVNNERISDPNWVPQASHFLHGKILLLRRGKKNYAIVQLT